MTNPKTYADCNCGRNVNWERFDRNTTFVWRTFLCPTRVFMIGLTSDVAFGDVRISVRPHKHSTDPMLPTDFNGVIIASGNATQSVAPGGQLWYFTWFTSDHGLRLPAEGAKQLNAASYGIGIQANVASDWYITIDTSEETDPPWRTHVVR